MAEIEKTKMEENYVYMLRCRDGSLYTGWTNDLDKRVKTHQSGQGGRYTRSRLPVQLAYFETYPTKQEAMRREWELKRLSKAEKEKLVRGDHSPLSSSSHNS